MSLSRDEHQWERENVAEPIKQVVVPQFGERAMTPMSYSDDEFMENGLTLQEARKARVKDLVRGRAKEGRVQGKTRVRHTKERKRKRRATGEDAEGLEGEGKK